MFPSSRLWIHYFLDHGKENTTELTFLVIYYMFILIKELKAYYFPIRAHLSVLLLLYHSKLSNIIIYFLFINEWSHAF